MARRPAAGVHQSVASFFVMYIMAGGPAGEYMVAREGTGGEAAHASVGEYSRPGPRPLTLALGDYTRILARAAPNPDTRRSVSVRRRV